MDLTDDTPSILMAEPSLLLFQLSLANNKVQNDNIFYKKLYYYGAAKVTLNNNNRPESQLHTETLWRRWISIKQAWRQHQLPKILACEHPTKQKMKVFWNLSGWSPHFSRKAAGLWGAQRCVTLQRVTSQENRQSEKPASNSEEFLFYGGNSKVSSLL